MKASFIISTVILLIDAALVYTEIINPFLGLGVAFLCMIPIAMD